MQNFSENLAMLGMIGLYTLAVSQQIPVVNIAEGFGVLIVLGMTAIARWRKN